MGLISNGTTIFNAGTFNVGGSLTLISTQTASNSASISFTTGIDSTYKEYQFWFIDIHPRTDNVYFQFNMSTDSGSNYNVIKTTTWFRAYHNEGDTGAALGYEAGEDLAQSTSYQRITDTNGNGADEDLSGSMQLFNPASTVYVKHFISNTNTYNNSDYSTNVFCAGYGNTTSAINAINFQMSSGNFDGTIAMYGVK